MSKMYILCLHTDFEDCTEVIAVSRSLAVAQNKAALDWSQRFSFLEDWLPILWKEQRPMDTLFPRRQWIGEMSRESNNHYTIDEMEEETDGG